MHCHSKLAAAVSLRENNLMELVFCGQFFPNMEPAFDTCHSDCEQHIMQGGNVDVLGGINVLMHWMLDILK